MDEQLISERTGHRSNALREYKRPSEHQIREISSLVQGSRSRNATSTVSVNPESIVSSSTPVSSAVSTGLNPISDSDSLPAMSTGLNPTGLNPTICAAMSSGNDCSNPKKVKFEILDVMTNVSAVSKSDSSGSSFNIQKDGRPISFTFNFNFN